MPGPAFMRQHLGAVGAYVGAMDTDGFEEWFLREHPKVVNSLFLVSGSVDAAKEAADEAFARAAARWPRVRAMDYPSAWTYRVALNALRKTLRRRARELELAASLAGAGTTELPIAYPEVWEAVRALPPQQRDAIVLRYVGDLPEVEVARVLGVRRGTVASTLSRARAALAIALSDDATRTRGEA
jgi:RNA polymerase sigma factor (sigma-70 family)